MVKARPVGDDTFEAAAAYLLAGDRAGYDDLCRWMQVKLGEKDEEFTAYVLARAGAVADPPGLPPAELVRAAERAVRDNPWPWYVHALGLARLRAGEWDAAGAAFERSNRADWGAFGKVMNWLGLAVAHARAGRADEARRCLAEAVRLLPGGWPDADKPPPGLSGPESAESVILRREAEKLLGGPR
ncbi:MAG: hypothetical protein K2X82_33765 [Gemmataceae bacterium]|nr:hypothetical protein [Gemmataceae bacterium]